jgi:transposase-like protein
MPRTCTVCAHADLSAVDKALVGGGSYRDVAQRFGLSKHAVARHRAEHLPVRLVKAEQAAQTTEATDLLREVKALRSKTYRILLEAEGKGDLKTALMAVREARGCLELLAEVEGQLDRRPQVSIVASPEWVAVRTALLAALRPYPDARQAVVERLRAVEAA